LPTDATAPRPPALDTKIGIGVASVGDYEAEHASVGSADGRQLSSVDGLTVFRLMVDSYFG
jgi:hypothetical protein